MAKIFPLSKALANQIAAGEVVERPASIVKELVENSLDAGATDIVVEIKSGGVSEISVCDNGVGMDKEDLLIATDKYTTSKIKNLEDLYHIMSFGFRGEALASIASVSEFSITSKTESQSVGCYLTFDGENKKIFDVPADMGTQIYVKNLFYNTPARLNYLKTEKTEQAHITDFLYSVSLAYPNVAFSFFANEKKVFSLYKNEGLLYRTAHVLGNDFVTQGLSLSSQFGGIQISGLISDPKTSYTNRNRQYIFVNKRAIKSPIIYKAVNDAYKRFIPHGNFPAYVLFIDIDPSIIDVNVHPRKVEVRFSDEQNIFRVVYNSVYSLLTNTTLTPINLQESPTLGGTPLSFQKSEKQYYVGNGEKFKHYSPYTKLEHNPKQMDINNAIAFSASIFASKKEEKLLSKNEEEKDFDVRETPFGKILGQVFHSYIIIETPDSIQFIDQHALAERVIYEKLCQQETFVSSQVLLFPETIHMTQEEETILITYKNDFESMGFEYEIVSSGALLLSSIPDFMKKEKVKEIFSGIIHDVGSFGKAKSNTFDEVKNKIRAYTACRSAIKFGDPLSIFEMHALLHDAHLTYSSTCPHGRPVVFNIGIHELKGKFER